MQILYVGFNDYGSNSYALQIHVKAYGLFFMGEVKCMQNSPFYDDYSYSDKMGLPRELLSDLIFRHQKLFHGDLQVERQPSSRALKLTPEQITCIEESLVTTNLSTLSSLPFCEYTLFKPNDDIRIIERFEYNNNFAKISLVSVNDKTGEEVYLKNLQIVSIRGV